MSLPATESKNLPAFSNETLPTTELRSALSQALNLEKEGKLGDEDLAKMDETVSHYLSQQLKVLAAQGMIREEPEPVAWHQLGWVQAMGAVLVVLLVGVMVYPGG